MSWPITIDLTNGHSHGADLVICAIGVSPNAGWLPQELERSGADGGVLVDRHVLLPVLASSSVARFFRGTQTAEVAPSRLHVTPVTVGTCRPLLKTYGQQVTFALSNQANNSDTGFKCGCGRRCCSHLPVVPLCGRRLLDGENGRKAFPNSPEARGVLLCRHVRWARMQLTAWQVWQRKQAAGLHLSSSPM